MAPPHPPEPQPHENPSPPSADAPILALCIFSGRSSRGCDVTCRNGGPAAARPAAGPTLPATIFNYVSPKNPAQNLLTNQEPMVHWG